MNKPEKAALQPEVEDYDARFEVVEPGFSEEQDRLHAESIAWLRKRVREGKPWKKIVADFTVPDEKFKAVILDDFLKITLAERHFQSGEALKSIAQLLHVPVELLTAVKEEMIREVRDASVQVYHRSRSEQTP